MEDGRLTTASGNGVVLPGAAPAALCLGFGVFLAGLPTGPVGTALVSAFAEHEAAIPLARGAFFFTLVLMLLVLRAGKARDLLHRSALCLASFAGMAVALALPLAIGTLGVPDVGAIAGAALFGAASAVPLLGWLEGFFALYRAHGKGPCIIVVAACSLASVLVSPATLLFDLGGQTGAAATSAALVLACAALHRVTARAVPSPAPPGTGTSHRTQPAGGKAAHVTGDDREGAGARVTARIAQPRDEFRPSVYVGVVGASFGFVWMTSCSMAAHLGFGQQFGDGPFWGILLAGVSVNLGIIALCLCAPASLERRFGQVLRWVIALIGAAWAFVPVASTLPLLGCFLCALIYTLVTTFVAMLVIELCEQCNATVCAVVGTLSTLFVGGLLVGIVAFGAYTSPALAGDGQWVSRSLVCAVSATAMFLSVPFLPSIRSSARDLSRMRLPETEGFEERLAHGKEALYEHAGLTQREATIVNLIVRGDSRDQIADQLSLSPSTVKNHVTSIYRKLGVHSGRELSALVLGLDERHEG